MDKWTFRLLWLLVFSIPIENMIVLPGVGTISRSIGIVAAAAAILSVSIKQEVRKPGPVQCLFVCFFLWIAISFYWSTELQNSMDAIKLYAKQGVFVWIIWEFAQSEERQIKLMMAYVLGAFIPILSIINAFIEGEQSSYFRYAAQGFDPNDIGLTIAIGVPIAWYIGTFLKDKILSKAFCLYVPLASIAIILTASRSSFICLMVALVFVISSFSRLSIIHKFAAFFLVLTSSFFIFKYIPSYSWARLMTIGSQVSEGDLGSRFNIWRAGLEAFSHDPLFGTGIGTFSTSVEKFLGTPISPHNLFLSIMVDLGIVGLFIFLAIVIAALVGLKDMDSLKRRLWIFVFATWFVGVMTLGWAHRKPTWFLISLVAVQGATYLKKPEKVHAYVSSAKI